MQPVVNRILAAVRTSEFWALAFQAWAEFSAAPVPEEFRAITWGYIAFRVAGKLARFVFPNPDSKAGAWMKSDS